MLSTSGAQVVSSSPASPTRLTESSQRLAQATLGLRGCARASSVGLARFSSSKAGIRKFSTEPS